MSSRRYERVNLADRGNWPEGFICLNLSLCYFSLICRCRVFSLSQLFSQNYFELDIVDSSLNFLQVLVCYMTLQTQGKDIQLFWRVSSFLFLKCWQFLFMFTCVRECHVYAGARGGQKRVPDSLKLELKAIVYCCSVWVLGTELWSSGIIANILNPWAIFLALEGILSWEVRPESLTKMQRQANCHLWEPSCVSLLGFSPTLHTFPPALFLMSDLLLRKRQLILTYLSTTSKEWLFIPNACRKQRYKVTTQLPWAQYKF